MAINTFKPLVDHFNTIKNTQISSLVQQNSNNLVFTLNDLTVDCSKNLFTQQTLNLFVDYANSINLSQSIKNTFAGAITNFTENRAVLHTALRNSNLQSLNVNNTDYAPQVKAEQQKMLKFVDDVIAGNITTHNGKKFKHVVNVGIGGSYLGILMAYDALKDQVSNNLEVHFVSNVDYHNIKDVVSKIDLETTLFIVASKTFTTQETMLNANTLKQIFVNKVGQQAVSKHFVALSTNIAEVEKFGINKNYIFGFWDFVGGRYSIWSVIGMAFALKVGSQAFKDFLQGAEIVDNYVQNTPLNNNLVFALASISSWYINYFNYNAYAILCYDYRLGKFTPFIQQLEMESNGKTVDVNNNFINYSTSPIVFGEVGTDSQHSFFQAIHQGSNVIPVDFIGFIKPNHNNLQHHNVLLANLIAQSEALMIGKNATQVTTENPNINKNIVNHKVFKGNRPSNVMLFKQLNAKTLGMLCAIYEHKILMQGLMWQINSFDQFGVELGKVVANSVLSSLTLGNVNNNYSKSSVNLINLVKSTLQS